MTIESFADGVLSRMTLDEKIGQCLTISWRGSTITPCVIDTITKLHVGGLRVEHYSCESATASYYGKGPRDANWKPPKGYFKIAQTYFRPTYPCYSIPSGEYAARLNRLKDIAMNRPCGVPLHVATDFEGDFSHDMHYNGVNLFPSNMGLAAGGGPELAYKVGKALARQLSALGMNMLHSPVCDININPKNPEINIRSFCDDPATFCKYVVKLMMGLEDGGLIATAKHFPGRGDSSIDAHHGMPVLKADRGRMRRLELAPYQALIRAGLRAVMTAHCRYPAFDESELPASLSPIIHADLLRKELGFQGVITTDAIGMGAIVNRWGIPVASAMALKAGASLVLLKSDGEVRTQTFFEIKRWVESGRITMDELDDRVRRLLITKAAQGLFKNGGKVSPAAAEKPLRDPAIRKLSADAARSCVTILRDRKKLLPVRPEKKKVLVVEQIVREDFLPNNMHYHAHSFNESMLKLSMNLINADCHFAAIDEEIKLILDLARQADVVVLTNFYWRVWPENNTRLIKLLAARKIPTVVVTNNPYERGSPKQAGTVVCTYSSAPRSLDAAAEVIFGKLKPTARWPLVNLAKPK
ncbi:MAG: hypothetical protein HZA50_16050 [Planctomycetes bacterium]|nr:hypothetical protein [Planctomycetota bacterium]